MPKDCYDRDADEVGSYEEGYSDVGREELRDLRVDREKHGEAVLLEVGGCAAAATLVAGMLELELARAAAAAAAVAAARRRRRTASFATTPSPR